MEDFLDQFNEYTLAEKIVGFSAIAALLFAVFYFLLYSGLAAEATGLSSEIDKLRTDRSKLQSLKEQRDDLLSRVESLQKEIDAMKKKLPSSAELSQLINLLNDRAKTAGLQIENFKRRNDTEEKFYKTITIDMKLRGTYGELLSFFESVDQMNRIVNMRNLSMSRVESGAAGGQLVVNTVAKTYQYKEQSGKEEG
jgi:type IV pilus assembly protein PilO